MTGTVNTSNTSNVAVTSPTSNVSKINSTSTTANKSNAVTTGTTTQSTQSTQSKKTADAAQVSKTLTASVTEHVASQPVQSSGLFGSNNNSGDIKSQTTAAQGQADEVATLIKDNNLSTTDALKVEKKFDTELKAAAGKPLTTAQLLDVETMVDDLATSSQTASTTTTPTTTTASTTSVDYSPLKISIQFNPSSLGGGVEIFLSAPETDDQTIEIIEPYTTTTTAKTPTTNSNSSVASSASTTNTTTKNPSTVVDSSLTQDVNGNSTRANSRSTVVVINPNAQSSAA